MPAIRFLLACISLFIGLCVILPTPTILLFQLKWGATELGHWFMFLPILVMIVGRRRSTLDSVSVFMAVMAVLLLSSTAARAALFAPEAEKQMLAVFPDSNRTVSAKPFSLGQLWSFAAPPGMETQTMKYSEIGEGLELDFYAPEGRTSAPCIIGLHLGGWDRGERREFLSLTRYLASRGYAVALIDYRLAPASPWPAQMEDTLAAMRFLSDRAEQLGLDPKKFVLMGRSAGGQIAEAVAVGGRKHGVIGCIALYSPADMNFAYKYADKKDVLDSEKLLRQYLGGTPAEAQKNYDSASPYFLVTSQTPPTLLMHGAHDELVWTAQSERYAARLREHGVKHVFFKVPWATHAFDWAWNSPGGQFTTWAVERFLASITE